MSEAPPVPGEVEGTEPASGKPRGVDVYKVATLALSLATVVLTFVSVILYRGRDEAQREHERVGDLITQLRERRAELLAIPRVSVTLQTLEESGLPGEALSQISEMPAFLRIEHTGGETARGLSVLVTSSQRIRAVQPGSSVEDYSLALNADSSEVRLDLPRFRTGSGISAILVTDGLASLSHEVRIELGRLATPADTVAELPYSALQLLRGDLSEVDAQRLTSVPQVDRAIEVLGAREPERFRVPSGIWIAGLSAVWLAFSVLAWRLLVRLRWRGTKGHGRRLALAVRDGLLTVGMPREEVEVILEDVRGSRVFATRDDGSRSVAVFYAPPGVMQWEPDLLVYYDSDRLASYHLLEYGARDYTQ